MTDKQKKVCPKCRATYYSNIEYCICGHKFSDVIGEFLKMIDKGLGKT